MGQARRALAFLFRRLAATPSSRNREECPGGCSGPKQATCAHWQRLLSTPLVAQILSRMLLQLYIVTLSVFTARGHQNVQDFSFSAHTPTRKGQWVEELPLGKD